MAACSDGGGGGGGGNDGSLNGTWTHEHIPMTLTVSGSNYTSKVEGENFGKGTVSYNSSTITLKTTHAWDDVHSKWASYSETTTCSYTLSGNSLTISGVVGDYSDMNGVWTR